MSTINERIEAFKEELNNKMLEWQNKYFEKCKECTSLVKDKSNLQSRINSMSKNIDSLENLTESQRDDLELEKDKFQNLGDLKKEFKTVKERLELTKKELESTSLARNELAAEKEELRLDLEKEQGFSQNLKKELKNCQDRLAQLEGQKKEYLNNIGLSKLNLSSMNFSKFFNPDPAQNRSDNDNSDMNKTSMKIERKIVFGDTTPQPQNKILEDNPPGINFFGQANPEPAMIFPDATEKEFKNNPYLSRFSTIRERQSVMKVRESRVSNLINAFGGIKDTGNFDFHKDYFSLLSSEKVEEELRRHGDVTKRDCSYSDTVFLFNSAFKQRRFLILVLGYSISFFNLAKNKMVKFYLLSQLKGLTISAENYTLAILHFEHHPDLLIESYRRLELISYLNHMFSREKHKKFDLYIRKNFILKDSQKMHVSSKIEVSDPNLKINLSFLQDAIRNSRKSGFLSKTKKYWFGATGKKEMFCVLSNIGIVCFHRYGVLPS